MTDHKQLIERLTAPEVVPLAIVTGGTMIGADGTSYTWGCERTMRPRNPDGAEAAQAILSLITERDELRRALAAIRDFKPDSKSETGPHTQIAIFAKQTSRQALHNTPNQPEEAKS